MLSIFYTIFDSRLSNGDFQSHLSILPQKDQDRIRRFKRWQDRQIHLACRLLLQKGLVECGYPPAILESVNNTFYGKPFINSDIEFSLSNSGTCAVCVISHSNTVGIDVETIRDIDISDFKSLMSLNEWKDIQNAKNRLKAFYSFWTKKEAILKADGRGFSLPLEQIHIGKNSAMVSDKKWFISEIPLDASHICHIAIENPVDTISIQKTPPENLSSIINFSKLGFPPYIEDSIQVDIGGSIANSL